MSEFRRIRRRDAAYPELLAAIHDPPPQLFLRGAADEGVLGGAAVAVVGARACSSYGRSVARSLGRDLAAAGLVVVSGMARGVDGEAHRGALEAGGVTVAVLGCGVDRDYPAAHAELARRICARGLVVSEYEPGVEPAPWRFPARNRVIAGLCAATVVVEARERSGALITADFALEEGREVLAVPGEITSALSAGTNALLRIGATPCTRADDVLELFDLAPARAAPASVSPTAADVLGRLRDGPLTADELVRASGLAPAEGSAALMELELTGAVSLEDGMYRLGARYAVELRRRRSCPTPSRSDLRGRRVRSHGPSDLARRPCDRSRRWAPAAGSRIVSMPALSYWLAEPHEPLSAVRLDGPADVAVVGGGITGCSCALALAEAGLKVRLFEAREIAGGASGRNGGFALRGGSAPYPVLREEIGEERTAAIWRWTEAEMGDLTALAGDAFRVTGSLRLAADEEERDELREEYEALRDAGFGVEWRDELPPSLDGRYPAAIFHPPDGVLQPARLVRRVARRAARDRCRDPRAHAGRVDRAGGRSNRRHCHGRVPERAPR